jgi:predicted ArsR family transcriptional regulator
MPTRTATPRSIGPRQPRQGTKQQAVLTLLHRPEGATVVQIAEATGWASHTVRRHADLLPDTSTARPMASAEPEPRRRGRPPKPRNSDLIATT